MEYISMEYLKQSYVSISVFIEKKMDLFRQELTLILQFSNSINAVILGRLKLFEQELENASFHKSRPTLAAELKEFKEYFESTWNAFRVEVWNKVDSLKKDMLLYEARQLFGPDKCWSTDGIIWVMVDGFRFKVESKADLEKIPIQPQDSMRDDANYTVSSDPEELEAEPPRKRPRRLRNKLIIDKTTTLSNTYMRERIADAKVELRCQMTNDLRYISPRVHVDMLLSRTASKCSNALGAMFARHLAMDLRRTPVADTHVEKVLSRRPVYQEPVEEIIQAEPSVVDKTVQEISAPVMQDISNIARSARNVHEVADISDLPTQKLSTASQEERARRASEPGETVKSTPARKNIQKKSRSQRMSSLYIPATEADKENIPGAANIQEPVPPEIPAIILPTDEERQQAISRQHLTSMLQEAGVVEQQQKPPSIEPTPTQRDSRRIRHSEGSETPLGSLDRTKVSLGDSEKTNDSKRFLDEQWGVEGTMLKIFRCVATSITPITVEVLVREGPVMESRQRIIAARCFTSILKLRTHGFIKVTKDEETNAIRNIELRPKALKIR